MSEYIGPPEPSLMRALYGPPRDNDPMNVTLRMLYARRAHIDLLISLISVERDFNRRQVSDG